MLLAQARRRRPRPRIAHAAAARPSPPSLAQAPELAHPVDQHTATERGGDVLFLRVPLNFSVIF